MSATSNAEMVVRIGRIARVEAKLVFMIATIEYSLLVGGRFLVIGVVVWGSTSYKTCWPKWKTRFLYQRYCEDPR